MSKNTKILSIDFDEDEIKKIISSLQSDPNVELFLRAEDGGQKYELMTKLISYLKKEEDAI